MMRVRRKEVMSPQGCVKDLPRRSDLISDILNQRSTNSRHPNHILNNPPTIHCIPTPTHPRARRAPQPRIHLRLSRRKPSKHSRTTHPKPQHLSVTRHARRPQESRNIPTENRARAGETAVLGFGVELYRVSRSQGGGAGEDGGAGRHADGKWDGGGEGGGTAKEEGMVWLWAVRLKGLAIVRHIYPIM